METSSPTEHHPIEHHPTEYHPAEYHPAEYHPAEYHYVYIVQCSNGSLYTGYSKNVDQRVAVHNAGKGGRYTRAHRPVKLLAYCQFQTKSEALRAEYAIKQLPRHKKLNFISGITST